MEQHKSRLGYTLGMLSLFLLGAVLFLIGFFPASYSAAEKDSTVPEGRPTTLHGVKLEPPPPAYDSFILFLVDALRDDFPDATSMPVAHSRACEKLTLHVDIPTVTMPRLKSITTGTLSNFIDIALNVGHTEQVEDSILHRLKQRDRVVSFAGDHTWVKLFPSEFTRRAENNDSFYVNDFYEGDRNVTRVLESELEKSDWSLLILHYLGLDHIGHVEGNDSPRITLKLKEMDEAVQKILEHKSIPNYLLMLTGDHGMADGGGHGGNTPAETLVPLYLYSKNCSSKSMSSTKTYNQIDLAPTLSVLLSVEIPTLSIGCLIPEMLQTLSLEHQLYAYFYNAHHLLNKARVKLGHERVQWSDYYNWYQNATQVHKMLLIQMREGDGSAASQVLYHNAKLNYMRVAREISGLLSESLVKFDYGFIALGLTLTTAASLHMVISVLYLDLTDQLHLDSLNVGQLVVSVIAAVLVNMTSHALDIIRTSSWLQSFMLLLPLGISVYLTIDVAQALLKIALPPIYTRRLKLSIPLPLPLLVCFAIRTLTLGSSSFIEFEYKTWYYLGNTLILLTAFRTLRRRITKTNVELDGRHLYTIASTCLWQMRKVFVMLMLLTLMRYIHRLQAIRSTIMIFSLLLLWARLHRYSASWMQSVASGAALCMVYCFRGLNGQVHFIELAPYLASKLMVPTLVVFWCCLALVLGLGYREALPQTHPTLGTTALLQLLQTNLTSSLLLAALLQKVQNILLLPVLLVALQQTYKLCDVFGTSSRKFSVRLVHVYKIIMTIFLARMFYFYQGNSNSLSTIDLTPGYIGQTSYNPIIVGLFVTLNTYGAEIHAFLYLIVHTLRSDLRSVGIMQLQPPYGVAADSLIAPLYAALVMLPAAFYLCLMVGFRYHLFIYSVFSPKALYDCYTVLVFYLVFLVTSLYFKLFKNDA